MTEELVMRLRSGRWLGETTGKEAADAIEALQAKVERLTYDGIHTCHDDCPRLPCVQRREIDGLRAEVAELESWKVAEEAHHHLLQADVRRLTNELQAHKDALAQAAPKP